MVPEGANIDPLPPSHISNLPPFTPKLESQSIRKTPGVDHQRSKPLTKDLKHVPASSQAVAPGGLGPRPNIMNPQLDAARRIGMPGSPSPMSNRGQYKAPTMMKRPIEGAGGGDARVPLVDLPANGAIGTGDAGGDLKRQRLNNWEMWRLLWRFFEGGGFLPNCFAEEALGLELVVQVQGFDDLL
jgi:DNA repair and recombination protein RAD52